MLRSSSANRYCKENLYWHFQAENVFLIKVSSPNNLLGYHSYCIWWYQGYHRYCIWWNHRIVNRFGLEGIFKSYLEQHPLRWAPHTLRHQTQLQNHCRWPFSSLNILSKILIMCLIKWVSLKKCPTHLDRNNEFAMTLRFLLLYWCYWLIYYSVDYFFINGSCNSEQEWSCVCTFGVQLIIHCADEERRMLIYLTND